MFTSEQLNTQEQCAPMKNLSDLLNQADTQCQTPTKRDEICAAFEAW